MSLYIRRRLPVSRSTWVNVSKSGASVSRRVGRVVVNSRGTAFIRTPIKGVYFRFNIFGRRK